MRRCCWTRSVPRTASTSTRSARGCAWPGIDWDLDGALVRGIDYYTRTIFEFTSDALGAQSGVAGGGRYDGLIELIGGPPTPGMGWAAGIERILLSAGERPLPEPVTDLYVAHEDRGVEAFALATEARAAGLAVQQELAGRSIKGQLRQADRAGSRYVAIVGADGIQLRDMDSGEQESRRVSGGRRRARHQGAPRG